MVEDVAVKMRCIPHVCQLAYKRISNKERALIRTFSTETSKQNSILLKQQANTYGVSVTISTSIFRFETVPNEAEAELTFRFQSYQLKIVHSFF